MKNSLKLFEAMLRIAAIALVAVIGFSLAGCQDPDDPFSGSNPGQQSGDITYTVEQTGGVDGTTNSTGIVFTFSASVDSLGLTAADITVGGKVTKGTLSGTGTTRTLGITVTHAGQTTVSIAKSGIEAGEKSVTVYMAGEAAPTLTGITLNTASVKKDYNQGETLDLTGLVVTANYSDITSAAITGYTASPANNTALSTVGSTTVTISYTEGDVTKTANFDVIVSLRNLTGDITISPASALIGAELTANYSGDESVTLVYQWKKDGTNVGTDSNKYTAADPGNYTVTVSADGYDSKTSNPVTVSGLIIIENAEIHITAPVMTGTPDTAATGTGDFSIGTVTWSPNHSPFQASTVYTATVTLTADLGHTFTGLTHAAVNGENATVTNNTGAAVTLSYTFAATLAKAVTGIAITTQPTTLTYTHGDTLDLAGLVVKLTYDDTTTEDVAFTSFTSHNMDANPAHGDHLVRSTHNNKGVTITYGSLHQDTDNLTVDAKNISAGDISVDAIAAQTYTGSALSPAVIVRDGTTALTLTTDYTTMYNSNTNAGSATVAITGAGNYTGSRNATFTINPKVITFTVDTIAAQTYTGSALTPTITVRDGLTTLTLTTHYTVTYSNNTNAGTATANVTGAGNYAGSGGSRTFTINKAAGGTVSTPAATTANITHNSVTLTAVSAPTGQTVEYARNTANNTTGVTWQDGVSFTGLNSSTQYWFFARSKENANYDAGAASSGTSVTTAAPPPFEYAVTGTVAAGFTATRGGTTITNGTGTIQNVIDAIRADAVGNAPTIQFGPGGSTRLEIGSNFVGFNNTGVAWTNPITLRGRIYSTNSTGTIQIADTVSVTSTEYIGASSSGRGIYHNSTAALNITGGTVEGNWAIHNVNTGTVNISGGTVPANTGTAVRNDSTGAVNISGGTVSATTGTAVYNDSTGAVNITGGTVSATSASGVAVFSNNNGLITVSGTDTVVTSTNNAAASGTVVIQAGSGNVVRLSVTGGTVRNTNSGNATARAVNNSSAGSVAVSGGTVSAAGSGTAIYSTNSSNSNGGAVNITGGTVLAGTGRAVFSAGPVTVSGTDTVVTSANTGATNGTIFGGNSTGAGASGTITITGGTVRNTATATDGDAVYGGYSAVNITGGTIEAPRYAVALDTGVTNTANRITLSGSPNISGGIRIIRQRPLRVTTSGANTFVPTQKYRLDYPTGSGNTQVTIAAGVTAVEGGANFLSNFELYNTSYKLEVIGSDLAVRTNVPDITTQPATTTTVMQGSISGSLNVAATFTDGTLSYQWYSNTTNSSTGGTLINGATGASYTIPTTLTPGTYYYYCEVSATGAAAPVSSNVATVTVIPPQPYEYTITGSGTNFTAARGALSGTVSITVGTGAIQTVVDAIRADVNGNAATVQFGSGGADVLDIGTELVQINNTGGTWGEITLRGRITSGRFGDIGALSEGVVTISGTTTVPISVISTADISSTTSVTGSVYSSRGIYGSNAELTINGGTISMNSDVVPAVSLQNAGSKVTVNDGTMGGLNTSNIASVTITGGTISLASGAINISSTSVATSLTVSDGTISSVTGQAISLSGALGYNVTALISGGVITSGNPGTANSGGTISMSQRSTLQMTGGTVENTSAVANSIAIVFRGTSSLTISGGTVSAERAVYTNDYYSNVTLGGNPGITGVIYFVNLNFVPILTLAPGFSPAAGRTYTLHYSEYTNAAFNVGSAVVTSTANISSFLSRFSVFNTSYRLVMGSGNTTMVLATNP